MITHAKDYAEKHRSTEQDRDNIEYEVNYVVFYNVVVAMSTFFGAELCVTVLLTEVSCC